MRCDVFIFLGSGSFFNFHELPLLKLLGKKILVIYLGSDARPPYFSGRYLDDLGNFKNAQSSFFESKKMLTKIIKIEKYADTTINHTATAQFFSKKFVRLNALGTPIDIQAISIISSEKSKNRNKATNNQAIRILHAPSRPIAKGSIIFRTIVNELRAEGYSIEYIELSGVSNQIVLEELHECDFVLDELYSDVPMAVLATEAAIFGKPVIVGGFYAKQYPLDNCDEEIPPSLYIDPAEIKHAIRKMLDDVTYRDSLGTRANYFVTKYWNSKKIAQNYLEVINNEAPKNWLCDPMKLDYCFGWGLSKENWLKQVGEYLGEMGSDALLLDHNPKLKQRVIEEISKAKGMHIS